MNPVTLNQKNLAYYHFEQYHGSMSSPPTERQEQIAAFLPSESLKLGIERRMFLGRRKPLPKLVPQQPNLRRAQLLQRLELD